jgi:hypothetical protein
MGCHAASAYLKSLSRCILCLLEAPVARNEIDVIAVSWQNAGCKKLLYWTQQKSKFTDLE